MILPFPFRTFYQDLYRIISGHVPSLPEKTFPLPSGLAGLPNSGRTVFALFLTDRHATNQSLTLVTIWTLFELMA
jgi:hypothetical protein